MLPYISNTSCDNCECRLTNIMILSAPGLMLLDSQETIVVLSHWNVGTVDIAQNGASVRRVIGDPGYLSRPTNGGGQWSKIFGQPWGCKGKLSPFALASKNGGGSQTMCLLPPLVQYTVWICLGVWICGFPTFLAHTFACHWKNMSLPTVDRRHRYKWITSWKLWMSTATVDCQWLPEGTFPFCC